MHARTKLHRGVLAALLLVFAAALPLSQAVASQPEPPSVPTTIQVDEGHKLFLVGHAVGVQIYSCNVSGGGYSWGFVAPSAKLYDDRGDVIMTHFAGPSWRAQDGSTIKGARVDGVPAENAIPWLLLSATPVDNGSEGDRLAGTKFIQRLATTGGLAPSASSCNADTAGDIEEVPYTADYYFWKLKP